MVESQGSLSGIQIMRVFILGATGLIGHAVAFELVRAGHQVVGMSRSVEGDGMLAAVGVTPLRATMEAPQHWMESARRADVIVQTAANWGPDMAASDKIVLDALQEVGEASGRLRLVYTGGCWDYGDTVSRYGNRPVTEDDPFHSIPSFQWSVRSCERLAAAPWCQATVIHPAMVYGPDGGTFEGFREDAENLRPVRVWGDAGTHWPIVHRDDLAVVYRLLVEREDLSGHFNASSEEGVQVGEIARSFARHYGGPGEPVVRSREEVLKQEADWADGPMLNQMMSSQKLRKLTGWTPKYPVYRTSGIFSD